MQGSHEREKNMADMKKKEVHWENGLKMSGDGQKQEMGSFYFVLSSTISGVWCDTLIQ